MNRSFATVAALFRVAALFGLLLTTAAVPMRTVAQMAAVSPSKVLLVINMQSEDSRVIGERYISKRHLPKANVLRVSFPPSEWCALKDVKPLLMDPIRAIEAKNHLDIDYILLTKGIPYRMGEGPAGGYCMDSVLTCMDWSLITGKTWNPYYGKEERFTHKKYNLYLVTRLDGYTRADALSLIDHSVGVHPGDGRFLIHLGPGHDNGGYKMVNDGMREAARLLTQKGILVKLTKGTPFPGNFKDLLGYYSWGSNDGAFDVAAYHTLHFLPGAIADTAVSTSARTLSKPSEPGQSLIADLVSQGCAGVKGYVSEPFADAIASADILFDRYTSGFSLAESFYAASRWVYWKDVVLGDPLCAPWAKAAK